MPLLEDLRSDLYASVKAACLGAAERIRGERAKLPPAADEPPLPTAKLPLSKNRRPLPTEAAIEAFSRWIATSAAPVANAQLTLSIGALARGASRLVGAPDMPDSLDWPHHAGKPLAFLAQIDLASLPGGIDWPAPRRGWLYFFLGANPDGVAVGNVDASPNRTLYFGGDATALMTRRRPEGTILPPEFSEAVPYAVSFKLGLSVPMGMAGAAATPWHRFENLATLDLGHLLLDTKPPVICESKDRMFGLPRHDQSEDSQFQAAATTAGYGSVMHLARWTVEGYRAQAPKWARPPSPDFTRLFEEMKARQASLESEAPCWCALFSLGSRLHRSPDRSNGIWHFNWWDAQTYRVLVDERRSRSGDFSQTFVCVND